MTDIAIENNKTSKFLNDFAYPLFTIAKWIDSRNLGNINSDSSTLLLVGSKNVENEHMKLAKTIFLMSVFFRSYMPLQMK